MNMLQEQFDIQLFFCELSRLRRNDPTLRHVSFGHLNGEKVREVADALRCNTHLESLSLYCLEAGDGGAAAIADIIRVNRSLEALFIVKGGIGADGAKAIAAALSKRNESGGGGRMQLAYLNLKYNKSGGRTHTPLIELCLSCNEIGDDGGRAMAAMLRSNTSIISLNLAACKIGDIGAKALAAALVANDTIERLFLGNNRIGADGAKAIAAALSERNESGGGGRMQLAYLNLKYNKIGDDGGRALAAMLRSNTSITNLILEECNIGDDGAKALAAALVANDTVDTLILVNNRIGDDGAKAIAAAYLLRLRCCYIDLNGNSGIGQEGRSALDQSLDLCRNANVDVDATDVPAAVALIEQLLPATNFLSLSAIVATKAAALRSAHPPKPGRLAILDTAQRLIIDRVLAQTRLIPDAAMPLAIEKIGESGDDDKNAIGHRSDTGINALFEVCIDKPHLFKDANMDEGMDGQGQGEEVETTKKTPQGNTSDKSLRVPAQDMKKRSGTRRYRLMHITNFFGKKITKV